MDINKAIAKHALTFIGGVPQVFQYNSADESKSIDIMTCKNSQYHDVDVFATIGLANHDIGLFHDAKSVRAELMAIGSVGDEAWANIIASAAFEVMDAKMCNYGVIIPNIVREYKNSPQFPHILLLSPNYWEAYSPLEIDDIIVAWLLAIPISDTEREYIMQNGTEAFEQAMEISQINIYDLDRKSLL